jgi:LuxR family maltose regulon positive regulatory protein
MTQGIYEDVDEHGVGDVVDVAGGVRRWWLRVGVAAAMSVSEGPRRRAVEVVAESGSDFAESSRSSCGTDPVGGAGKNEDPAKLAPGEDVLIPNGSARALSSAVSLSPDVIGSSVASHDGVGEGVERAVLLATKLHVPGSGGELVERGALLDALSAGRRRKLTLLSAPAGWGKTTLLAQWALVGEEHQRCGWLSLDRSDNDPVWFWMYVVAALQKVDPGVGCRAVELLVMGADPVQVVLPSLLNDLDAVADPVVLILDDYHLVVNPAVHEQVAFVIGRMPVNLHVVLATRSDPPLPLARLRACGDLAELRSDELRFEVHEAERLLNDVLGLGLAQADVQLLHRRTEGWAGGLYLAALSLGGRPDAAEFIRTFAGDNRHIADYLMCEVLDGLLPEVRSFLLHTSVLGRLSGALCDAVLHTSGSASVLDRIERDNLFVVPLDTSRRWYRYHHLFGELLRAELHRVQPAVAAGLHQRAAAWFETEGLIDEAVRHLVAAGDIARSADVIAADWLDEFTGGGLATVSGWLDLLPDDTVSRDPRLSAARAWIALNLGQFDDARSWIDTVEVGSTADTVAHGSLEAQLLALRAVHAFKTGNLTATLQASRRAITLDFDNAPQGLSAAYCVYGSALYFSASIDDAQATFWRAAQLAEKIRDRRHRIYALGYLGLIAAESGQLAEAEYQIRRATSSTRDLADGEHSVNAVVSLAAAIVLDGRGDAAAAAEAAEVALGLARKGAGILEVAHALLVRAEILGHLGAHQRSDTSRQEAARLLQGHADPLTAQRLLAPAQPSRSIAVTARNTAGAGAEDLTAKELVVLRLMATRLSRREIGQRLYVSLNTVKTHQRALYRKLGVEDRNAAVARARELGLLPSNTHPDPNPPTTPASANNLPRITRVNTRCADD